ncbi:MAG: Asp-tRNA(Asn)/Glu-tRNA(Gln) amidotransferase subunit GatA [Methanobrevibacter sp.]|nr:Asp-tRNA(Asn)/Glu-tRNA(Gln) amidotransferase subunit GatA [Methanobrevibacter sp.]
MNIFEKSKAIKNHDIKAIDNLENFTNTIEKKNKSINAFIELNTNSSIAKAKEIDEKIKNKEKVGLLAGLVFGVKADISVEDLIISAGSKTLENYYGSFDARAIKRIKEEDGIIIGMTNMDEFGAGCSTESSFYGVCNNPAASGLIPGGSSGGSAAAIGANMCDISLGTDTGGSIRNPASHCGVIGFKPSYGAISRQGLLDFSPSFDQIGPLANDMCGIAMALDTIVGYDKTDYTSLKEEFPNFTEIATEDEEKLQDSIKNMKIATIKQFHERSDDKVNNVVDKSLDKLKDLGADIVELSFDYIDLCLASHNIISYVEFFSGTRKFDGIEYGHKIEDVCGEEVLRRIEIGAYISETNNRDKYYKKALQGRTLIVNEVEKLFKDVDLIVGPTLPKLPYKIGENLEAMEMYDYDAFTVIANLVGAPAGSIKAGDSNGIPVGLQFEGKRMDDAKVIRAMSAYESIQ